MGKEGINVSYHNLLLEILKNGFTYNDPNRKGVNRIQIPSYQFKHDFKDGFPAITTKKLFWKGVVAELLWFLRGDTNIKYLVDNGVNIWNKDAYNYYLKQYPKIHLKYEDWLEEIGNVQTIGDLGRVYGAQWRNFIGYHMSPYHEVEEIDQISNLIKGLKENPMGTKHIVTAWNPAELDKMALPPCHWSFEILVEPIQPNKFGITRTGFEIVDFSKNPPKTISKVKYPKYQFTLKWHQRSVDTFLGLPFNIASYALLAQIIGKMTNMIPKGIIGDLSNVHIYEPHLEAVKEQLSRNVDKYDGGKLNIPNVEKIFSNEKDLNEVINSLEIKDFILEDYKSYPAISAEMLPYNK